MRSIVQQINGRKFEYLGNYDFWLVRGTTIGGMR